MEGGRKRPLCFDEVNYSNTFLNCSQKRRKWPTINEELAYTKSMAGTEISELRRLGTFPYMLNEKNRTGS
jgi:hypothetical protein